MKALSKDDIKLLNNISFYLKNSNERQSLHAITTTLGLTIDNRTPAMKLRDDANEIERKEQDIINFKELVNKLNK